MSAASAVANALRFSRLGGGLEHVDGSTKAQMERELGAGYTVKPFGGTEDGWETFVVELSPCAKGRSAR